MATWTTHDIPDQSGKLAVVTGATGGLGLETALDLAGAGAEVILAGRNPAKGRDADGPHSRPLHRTPTSGSSRSTSPASPRSRPSPRACSAAGRPIDILINNAGVMAVPKRQSTADGFEMQFGTNYLSHFALTGRLLPLLIAAKARVVQLSSMAHRGGAIRLDDLNYERGYKPWPVYQQSKLAMLMFAIELDRRSRRQRLGPDQRRRPPRLRSHGPDRQRPRRRQRPVHPRRPRPVRLPQPLRRRRRPADPDGRDNAGRHRRPVFRAAGRPGNERPARPRQDRTPSPRRSRGRRSVGGLGAPDRRHLGLKSKRPCRRTGMAFHASCRVETTPPRCSCLPEPSSAASANGRRGSRPAGAGARGRARP